MTHKAFSPERAQRLANSITATAMKRLKSEVAAKRGLDSYLNAWTSLLESPKTSLSALKTLKRILKKHKQLEHVAALQTRIDKFLQLPPNEQEQNDCLLQPVGFRRGPNPDTNSKYANRMLDVGFCCEALLCDQCDERLLLRASPSSWEIIKSELKVRHSEMEGKELRVLSVDHSERNSSDCVGEWVEVCDLNNTTAISKAYSSRSGLWKWICKNVDEGFFESKNNRNLVEYGALQRAWLSKRRKELPSLKDLMRGADVVASM